MWYLDGFGKSGLKICMLVNTKQAATFNLENYHANVLLVIKMIDYFFTHLTY